MYTLAQSWVITRSQHLRGVKSHLVIVAVGSNPSRNPPSLGFSVLIDIDLLYVLTKKVYT